MNIAESIILVVDDNPSNLNVLFDIFSSLEYDVLFASDGETCLKLVESEQPDLILLDVMMPGFDGFETCQRLKASEKTRSIPVIFMTALADTADKVRGFEVGAVDYITKPIRPGEVLARVKTHLTLRKMYMMLEDREAHLRYLVEEKTRQISNITLALVNALENANKLNDTDTGNHIKRVGEYAGLLAEGYGCDHEFVKRIRLYAPLHDVGKVGLPDSILQKPGKYNDEELLKMQYHVEFGAELLSSVGIDPMARNIAKYHHERWDGTGYVERLAGTDIPLEARIVSVVDVYDALISTRLYKLSFSEDKADRIIQEGAGKHFDPDLVEVFFQNKDRILNIRSKLV
ncbi:two-component system response regulator [candidate division KSB3 bacterium]|uniref:Two-component system response regulator n=1 Tax=candidate division KSB3 bacterium TaxID=2044937 RepID=A0A2G6E992_9BACT|nr:MAG: two-component system response regulator [candidate division KSB3 bacterium]PIE29604.1 MAG: two-component system response regulator [candidate division KSB3 bacterium]